MKPLMVLGVTLAVIALSLALLTLWAAGRAPSGAEATSSGAPPGAPRRALTFVTWNIHYGCGPTPHEGCCASSDEVRSYLDSIAGALREIDADVVALQEVDRDARRSHRIDELAYLQRATGLPFAAWTVTWEARWVPYPGLDPRRQFGRVLSGQAILSRYPLLRPERVALPQPPAHGFLYNLFYLHRALLAATLEPAPGLAVRIVDAHLEAFDVANRMEHARRTAELVAASRVPTVLLGDMNSVPPVAKLRAGFPDEPETDMREDRTYELLAASGLREVVPLDAYSRDERPWLTFPALAPNRRLDYVFVSPTIAVEEVEVLAGAHHSDHLPVVARLRLP